MRWLILLSGLILMFSTVYTQQFEVKASFPTSGASGIASVPDSVFMYFVFSSPIDTSISFPDGWQGLPPFLSFLAFDPIDSIKLGLGYLSRTLDTIGVWAKLAPNTDYCIVLLGAYSTQGELLSKPYVVNFTTSSTIGQRSVSGTITVPSQRMSSIPEIPKVDLSKLKLEISNSIGAFDILSGSGDVKVSKKINFSSPSFKFLNIQPSKILGVDPNVGIVALLDGNPFVEPEVNVKYAANVNSDFSFSINYVRDGTYYLFAAFDTVRDGQFNPTSDLIIFYDANGDGQPDPITVSGGNVTGLNIGGVWQIRPFTVNGMLPGAKLLAQSYANDVKLKAISAFEGMEIPTDTLDGKVYFASYIFYSPSKGKYVYVWANAFAGLYFDTVKVPEVTLVDLPPTFVDSDVAFDSAEANGGYAFRNKPNTIVGITYDLRNYPDDDLAPDTVNPYWRIVYIRSDTTGNNLGGILIIYLNPSNGRLVKKFEFSFAAVTAKQKFNEVDSLAKSYASDAKLVYVFGLEDSLIDGKCYVWNYGYRTGTGGKFSVWLIAGAAGVDTFFLDLGDIPIPLNKPLQFGSYKDSDGLAAVAEANGGARFRSMYRYTGGFYVYSQSLDTTKIYFHAVYSGIDTTTGRENVLIVFVDPVTGNFVALFTKVEKDETAGIPTSFMLHQNYPNPFNPMTTITYDIPVRANVKLVVYNILGQEVATLVNEVQEPGRYNVKFDASGLPSGVYFYKLEAGKYVDVKKMVLVK